MSTLLDHFMPKVCATSAITNLADPAWPHCVHTWTENLIAKIGALAATRDGKNKDRG